MKLNIALQLKNFTLFRLYIALTKSLCLELLDSLKIIFRRKCMSSMYQSFDERMYLSMKTISLTLQAHSKLVFLHEIISLSNFIV